jgi:hypothetical protein
VKEQASSGTMTDVSDTDTYQYVAGATVGYIATNNDIDTINFLLSQMTFSNLMQMLHFFSVIALSTMLKERPRRSEPEQMVITLLLLQMLRLHGHL